MTQLIPVDQLPSTQHDEDFAKFAKNFSFLPSLKLYNPTAAAVVQDKIKKGCFGLSKGKDDIKDLSDSVDIIPLAHRYKAVEKVGDKYYNYFNPSSENFAKTQKIAEDRNSGSMCGIEFLFWLPEEQTFCLFYACNTSSLNAANEIKAMYGRASTIKSKMVKTPKHIWYAPFMVACVTDLAIPDPGIMETTLNSFKNPKESEVEVVTEEGSASSDR